MKCKCSICKKEIDKDTAFKFTMEGQVRAKRCCSEDEYNEFKEEMYARSESYKIMNEILSNNQHSYKERMWKNIRELYSGVVVRDYLKNNKDMIIKSLERISSNSNEFQEIRYFESILKNNLRTWEVKPIKEEPAPVIQSIYDFNPVMPAKRKRRNLSEISLD